MMSAPENQDLELEELQTRIVYAFIQASASLSATFGFGLKTFERLAHMAAFHVLRRQRFDLNQIAQYLKVSRRKVDLLSRVLKDHFFDQFVAPEDGEALQRRIEFMLWAQPMSAARLKQVMPKVANADIDSALESLAQAGRVANTQGEYTITHRERRLVRDHWLARLGGLNHQLKAVTDATLGRFVRDDDAAFARTASLRVKTERLDELEVLYATHIWPTLVALDAECSEADDDAAVPITFSICWAPQAMDRPEP